MVYEGGGRLDALGDGVLIVGPNGKALDASMPLVIGDTLIFQGHDDSSDYFGRATGLKKIQLRALGTENTAAAADTLWAMWSEPVDDDGKITHLVAGPVGSDGEPTGEAHELARIKTDKGQLTPIFGLGEGEVRVVVYHHRVYEVPSIVWVVRSRDGGKTWPERFKVPHEAPRVEEDWSRRRIDISWNRSGTVMWLGIVASNLEGELKPRRLAANLPRSWSWQRRTCVGPTKAWWSLDKVLYSVDDEAITPLSGSHGDHDFLHCDDERIVALSSEYGDDPKVKLTLCDPNGCKGSVSVPNVAGSRYVSGYGATIGPLVAVILDGILIVWAGDPKKNESFDVVYTGRLPDTYRLSGLVEWDGKLVAVISDGDALRLLLVPLAR